MGRTDQKRREQGSLAHGLFLSNPRPGLWAATAVVAVALAACGERKAGAAETPPAAAERPTPSGLPVPRWVSLKFGEVSARNGPGEDHRLLWTYRAKGLPVQVVAETREWRRVCDGDGQLAWVHKRGIDGRRNVMNLTGAPLPVQGKADQRAATSAYFAPGAIAELDRCRENWCRLEAAGMKGWVPAAQLWGTAEALGCNAPPRR